MFVRITDVFDVDNGNSATFARSTSKIIGSTVVIYASGSTVASAGMTSVFCAKNTSAVASTGRTSREFDGGTGVFCVTGSTATPTGRTSLFE